MKPIIRVENLSKQYRIGAKQAPYKTLRESVTGALTAPLRWLRSNPQSAIRNPQLDTFWALKDVNFEVSPGEVIGIIGRNGAGKSTLLKILSRITEPTTGKVNLYGRVGSLLEVGTGFHAELSGRENIYLNGAVLGMKRIEIERKFDEIVAFAEIEKFIDTPVKHYSSGMYMRLAFAVAANLEPEILIVDEVLAVGDVEFQKKCLGKMEEVSKRYGRTVLFVSHDMTAISRLTDKAIFLRKGVIGFKGNTIDTLNNYLLEQMDNNAIYRSKPKSDCPHITSVQIITSEINNVHIFGKPLEIQIEVNTPYDVLGLGIGIQILDTAKRGIVYFSRFDGKENFLHKRGKYKVICHLPAPRLYMGNYFLKVDFAQTKPVQMLEQLNEICHFEIRMDGIDIEHPYGWIKNNCVYLENCMWQVE